MHEMQMIGSIHLSRAFLNRLPPAGGETAIHDRLAPNTGVHEP